MQGQSEDSLSLSTLTYAFFIMSIIEPKTVNEVVATTSNIV